MDKLSNFSESEAGKRHCGLLGKGDFTEPRPASWAGHHPGKLACFLRKSGLRGTGED